MIFGSVMSFPYLAVNSGIFSNMRGRKQNLLGV